MELHQFMRRSGWLVIGVVICLILAGGCSGGQNSAQPNPTHTPSVTGDCNELEQSVFQQINEYRRSQGLPALTWNEQLAIQARNHSRDMAAGTVPFGHDGFEERIAAAGIPCISAAENVATNQGYADPATVAVQGWLASSGHKRNIEGTFNLTGIGIVKNSDGQYYFTQIFLRSTE